MFADDYFDTPAPYSKALIFYDKKTSEVMRHLARYYAGKGYVVSAEHEENVLQVHSSDWDIDDGYIPDHSFYLSIWKEKAVYRKVQECETLYRYRLIKRLELSKKQFRKLRRKFNLEEWNGGEIDLFPLDQMLTRVELQP